MREIVTYRDATLPKRRLHQYSIIKFQNVYIFYFSLLPVLVSCVIGLRIDFELAELSPKLGPFIPAKDASRVDPSYVRSWHFLARQQCNIRSGQARLI